jgi:leader peptidase (prepilin peptidase) / N-methyltransferase
VLDTIPQILIFVFGLCLGSFINVVIARLPREDLSIGRPARSCCPRCRKTIHWYDNLPLVSWVILRGRCRYCHQPISLRYPLVELTVGLLVLAVYARSGFSFRTVADIYFVSALVAITFIDLDEMIIPDALTLPGMIIALVSAGVSPDLDLAGPWATLKLTAWGVQNVHWISLIGAVMGIFIGGALVWIIYQAYFLWRREEGIGGGDFTLLAMIGGFLGWRAVFLTVFWGSIAALVAAVVLAVRQGSFDARMKLPYGPFLSLAALVYLFWGRPFLSWYLG